MTITHTGLGDPSIKSESHFSTTSLFQAKSEAIIGNYALGAELIGDNSHSGFPRPKVSGT